LNGPLDRRAMWWLAAFGEKSYPVPRSSQQRNEAIQIQRSLNLVRKESKSPGLKKLLIRERTHRTDVQKGRA